MTYARDITFLHMKADAIKASLTQYQNQWVALNNKQDKVLANGRSLKVVISRTKKSGHENAVFMKVPSVAFTISPAWYGF